MTEYGDPSIIVRIPTPVWLVGMLAAALLLGELLRLPAVVQQRPVGIVVLLAGPFEEGSMKHTFGYEYDAYRAHVRRWI